MERVKERQKRTGVMECTGGQAVEQEEQGLKKPGSVHPRGPDVRAG